MEKQQSLTQCKNLIYFIRFVPKNFNAFVILETEEKLCLELYNNMKSLGRITLRASGETLAAGIVVEFV